MDNLIRHKTGGQPGNQNARKHGFYSKVLPLNEKRDMMYAAGLDGIDQEIAVLRIKFRSLLEQDGQNLRLINQTARTLARMYTLKYSLSRNDSSKLREAVNAVLEEFIIPRPPDPHNKSESQTPSHPEGAK